MQRFWRSWCVSSRLTLLLGTLTRVRGRELLGLAIHRTYQSCYFIETTDLPWTQVYQGAGWRSRTDHAAHAQAALVQDAGISCAASPLTSQKLPKKHIFAAVKLSSLLPLPFSADIWHALPFSHQGPSFIQCQPL